MRNSKIPLHVKQSAYAEYKNGVKVTDILDKYKICFGTLYDFIHKQEETTKLFKDNHSRKTKSKPKQTGGNIISIDDALSELNNL